MTPRLALRAALLSLPQILAAFSARAAEPIEIAVIGPLTGGTAPVGVGLIEGVTIAVDKINDAGGVLGRPLRLVVRDDKAVLERSTRFGEELTKIRPVAAAVGLANTGIATSVAAYFEDAQIPLLVAAAAGSTIATQFGPPEYRENYIFHVAVSTRIEAAMLVDHAIGRGFRRLAVFGDSKVNGQAGQTDLASAVTARGLAPTTIEKFNVGDVNMDEQLERARAAATQAILVYGVGAEPAYLALGRSAMGWDVPLIGAWTLSMSNFIDTAGPAGENTVMVQSFVQEGDTALRKSFLDAIAVRFGAGRLPSAPAAAQGYDSILLLAAAITQAGSTDGTAIRIALEHLDRRVEGVVKTYDHPFTPENHEALERSDLVLAAIKGGRAVRLTPATPEAPRDGHRPP